ncbi:hypothetical protein N7D90_07960 [Pseudomonas fragi]|uniref:hypothetical protein n=1 Tax=Pseudomonas fragi TaxID=296 RepID=UPI0021C0AD1B|nr:hypothetical protein [Pseudomonas fragi]UXL40083.1 hypothetical protein N7D90_07960 [Pseudomonas fragi]
MRELAKVEGENLSGFRLVAEDQYELYRSHRNVVAQFSKNHELLKFVLEEYERFQLGLVDVGHAMAGEPNLLNQNHLHALTFKTNSLMLGFLGSVRTFLDHAGTSISRRYGKSSEQFLYFKELTAHQFDNLFSYRFLYKLRNYTQHCGMPPVSITVNIIPGDELEIAPRFSRQGLLDSYSEWGSALKKELELDSEPLYVFPLLKEHRDSVIGIYLSFYEKFESVRVVSSKDWICGFLSDPQPDDKYCFLAVGENGSDPKSKSFNLEWIPTSMLRDIVWVEQHLKEALLGVNDCEFPSNP